MTDTSFSRPMDHRSGLSLSTLFHWLHVAQTRRDLADLDATALADIGLSAEQARKEAARPVWDAPSRWIKG